MNEACVRCGHLEDEHPEPMTPAEALVWPTGGPCHRFEPPAGAAVRKAIKSAERLTRRIRKS